MHRPPYQLPGLVRAPRLLLACSALAAAITPNIARAHIIMQGVLLGREGDQKAAPCEGLPRSATPFVFEPGATITLSVLEGIPHDGYFRIAFDNDGTDFLDPRSIAPINPDRYGTGKTCAGTPDDHCGTSDFCNMSSAGDGPTVLWDQLDAHLGTEVTFGQVRSWNVTLPNVECANCTLQVMQVMEDPPGHGPFDGMNDLYYRCVDIVLRKGAGNTPGTATGPVQNQGIECAKRSVTTDGGTTDSGTTDSGTTDSGTTDGGTTDGGTTDSGTTDPGAESGDAGGCSIARGQTELGSGLGLLLAASALLRRRRAKRRL